MSVLRRICDSTRERVAERQGRVPRAELEARLVPPGGARPFRVALERPGLSVIAEFKRRSPSAGEIRAGAEVGEVVSAYEAGGAAALSVLTEEQSFGGSLDDLVAARACSGLPILRKDFVVDEYQVVEARAFGADAVLLIVAALTDGELAALSALADEIGLDVLVEVHDGIELERALAAADPRIIGVNHRDLRDFSVDTGLTRRLMADIPAGRLVVSESGIVGRDQAIEMEEAGADAILVGERLMREPDPGRALIELTGTGGA